MSTDIATEIRSFEFIPGMSLRAIMLNGEPWFLAKDVTDALGYTNGRDAVANPSQLRVVGDTDLRDALRKVGRSRKRGRTAERMLSEIRQMYRWSIKRPPWKALLSDGNPAELVEAKQVVFAGYETIIRDRVLKPNEKREAWRRLGSHIDSILANG